MTQGGIPTVFEGQERDQKMLCERHSMSWILCYGCVGFARIELSLDEKSFNELDTTRNSQQKILIFGCRPQ